MRLVVPGALAVALTGAALLPAQADNAPDRSPRPALAALTASTGVSPLVPRDLLIAGHPLSGRRSDRTPLALPCLTLPERCPPRAELCMAGAPHCRAKPCFRPLRLAGNRGPIGPSRVPGTQPLRRCEPDMPPEGVLIPIG